MAASQRCRILPECGDAGQLGKWFDATITLLAVRILASAPAGQGDSLPQTREHQAAAARSDAFGRITVRARASGGSRDNATVFSAALIGEEGANLRRGWLDSRARDG